MHVFVSCTPSATRYSVRRVLEGFEGSALLSVRSPYEPELAGVSADSPWSDGLVFPFPYRRLQMVPSAVAMMALALSGMSLVPLVSRAATPGTLSSEPTDTEQNSLPLIESI